MEETRREAADFSLQENSPISNFSLRALYNEKKSPTHSSVIYSSDRWRRRTSKWRGRIAMEGARKQVEGMQVRKQAEGSGTSVAWRRRASPMSGRPARRSALCGAAEGKEALLCLCSSGLRQAGKREEVMSQ